MVGSCWLHIRLKLYRTGWGGGGVAGSCCFHCRLRLCSTLSREGEDGGFLLASL